MSAAEMRALSARAIAAWNERRFDDFYALYHPDVLHHSADGVDRHGVIELRTLYDSVLAVCPDLTITPISVVADPEAGLLASIQTESGTTVGGDAFGFQGMLFLRLSDDGLVHEAWEQIRPL
ncbi:MAG TPA: nuclear transport factor 2 family protein [Mycobacteriales bacterium]|jgi:hypothetical protein|nr:nuclear transport factor 2 family protein [Mycobacteriales bacterium]